MSKSYKDKQWLETEAYYGRELSPLEYAEICCENGFDLSPELEDYCDEILSDGGTLPESVQEYMDEEYYYSEEPCEYDDCDEFEE